MKASASLLLILSVTCITAQRQDDVEMEHQGTKLVRRKRDLPGTTLRVVGIDMSPYTMKKDGETTPGAHTITQYEGFIPDLLNLITDRTHIEFDFYMVPDRRFGAKLPNGSWTGMIGEVIKRTADQSTGADLAAAPLTMHSGREDVVDYINPFQHLGLSIIYKKQPRDSFMNAPIQFQILSPLSPGVWLMILGAFLLVSLLLWLINRFNPYEWRGQYERGHATLEDSEKFDVSGALWFTFTTLQWQGYESSPRSFGSRVLVGFWFIFVTITLVTYTGAIINNLFWASTVMAPKDPEPFKDLLGLVKNTDYKYGCVYGGSTYRYLTTAAKGEAYDAVRRSLQTDGGRFQTVNTTAGAIDRVLKGGYAFIGESTTARYLVSKNCDLAMTHKLFAKRAFGMAIRNNTADEVREALHGAILELMEEGDIEALEEKWFDEGNCPDQQAQAKAASSLFLDHPALVSVKMFAGPMFILLVGLIASLLATVAEIIYFRLRGRFQPSNQPRGEKLQEEM